MKRKISLLLALCLLALTACTAPETPTEPALSTTAPVQTQLPAEEDYTVSLGAQTAIHEGPGYDYIFVRSVGEDGVFTVVEEMQDEEGNLWGRLKSGAGWVDLTRAQAETEEKPPVSIFMADRDYLRAVDCHTFMAEDSQYTVLIAFLANEPVTNVSFTALDYSQESYVTSETLYTLETMDSQKPFVAGVVFYGSMTVYGISFTDAGGETFHYSICISGRNGALEVAQYQNP